VAVAVEESCPVAVAVGEGGVAETVAVAIWVAVAVTVGDGVGVSVGGAQSARKLATTWANSLIARASSAA
jgi:hypothetical protein